MRHLPVLLSLLLASSAALAAEVVPGEVVVRWRVTPQADSIGLDAAAIAPGRKLRRQRAFGQVEVLRLQGATRQQTRALAALVARRADVVYAHPNYYRRPLLVPSDQLYPLQWGLPKAQLEAAWDLTTGSSAVVVAIVDTGIRADHPDLAGRLLPGYDFITTLSLAGDGDGRDADPTDVGSVDPAGSSQHGTHIAGIIGATSNNGIGVAGVDWACKILPVRALGVTEGRGSDADIAAAIRWAAGLKVDGVPDNANPAHIINLSFGGEGRSDVLANAVRDAINQGALVVTAAGNDGVDGGNTYPAALPDVLNVGAVGYDGLLAPYSNHGDALSLVAPGGNLEQQLDFPFQGAIEPAGIVSTIYDTNTQRYGYHMYEGTSQAAPLVAGVAALVLAANDQLSAAEVRQVIISSADPSGRCDAGCGSGIVDAAGAVEAAVDLIPPPPPDPADGLPFGASCSANDECADKTCRDVGAGLICTVACTAGHTPCPGGTAQAECIHGFCVPTRGTTSVPPGETPELLGGCNLAASKRAPVYSALALLSLLVLVGQRRRRR